MQNETNIFTDNGIDNIFNGAILTNENGEKQPIGYRLENSNSVNCPIYARGHKDNNGVYSANGFVYGIKRRNQRNKSLFFPSDWTKEKVIEAISEAYETREVKNSKTVGTSANGLKIRLWLNENGKIFDAMPFRTNEFGEVITRPARKRKGCKTCGQPKHSVCFNHSPLPNPKISTLILKKVKFFSRKFYFNLIKNLGFSV